ncbi:MAG: deoxynucleoside kinase [Myxococcota bacterium]|nr:deoxynucleoside kinase [Myxococcota bacterium]
MNRFLVIEGLIGVGKTTLCKLVRDRYKARLVLEPWAENPFLASFYDDPERFAFPAQMFYLANRYQQQQTIRQQELFEQFVVADYLFEKDRLFAEQTLGGVELELYDRFAGLLSEGLPNPDLIIFLDAPTEVILKRIAIRGIEAEQQIEPAYLDSLRERYYALWARYTAAPVRILRTEELDYVNNMAHREQVLELIQSWLEGTPGPGVPASTLAQAKAERETQPSLFGTPGQSPQE